MTEEELFQAAIETPEGRERETFLRAACGGDEDLYRRVTALLEAHERPDSLFQQSPLEPFGGGANGRRPQRLGDFDLVRQIGHGGMGVVYEAVQRSLNRRVALKVLSSGLGLSSKAILRFRREAEAAAKLHHTNIVPIYATGEDHGVHYYAMELVEGPSLDKVIQHLRGAAKGNLAPGTKASPDAAGSKLPEWVAETIAFESTGDKRTAERPEQTPTASTAGTSSTLSSGSSYFDQVARMMADVAAALDHAHEQGVIHRDVKPSNLLLSSDGRLSINDFGLARMLEQPGMTMSGEFVGTPYYMSPEQITAGRAPLDHRTDIYSLGATLYELLTLQPPFPGRGRDEVIAKVMHKDPERPRRVNKRIPQDLETICLKCLEKDPDRRYQTAGQLAEDLRRFVNRYAISARRTTALGRTAKWVRRHPGLSASYLIISSLLLLLAGTGYFLWRLELDRSREKTIELAMSGRFAAARRELETVRRLHGSQGWIHMLEGQIEMQEGQYEQSGQSLREAVRLLPDSTQAYSMLTIVHYLSGDEAEYIRSLPVLEKREAKTFYDRLFKGYAESWFLSHRSLENLEAAVNERPDNQTARVLRARTLLVNGMAEPQVRQGQKMAMSALEDLEAVRHLWPETPWLLGDYIRATSALMLMSRELGHPDDEARYRSLAETAVDKLLSQSPVSPAGMESAIGFFRLTNQEQRLLTVLSKLKADGRLTSYAGVDAANALYRMREPTLSLDAFRRSPSNLQRVSQWVPALIQMDAPAANRQEVLRQLEQEIEPGRTGVHLLLYWPVLRLLGVPRNDPRALDVADQIRTAYGRYMLEEGGEGQFGDCIAQFMRDSSSWEELMHASRHHRGLLAYAHYTAGVDELAEGNRTEAKRHFAAAVATNFYLYYAWAWSWAFLDRVDDPEWLPWLPHKGELNTVVEFPR